MSTTPNDLPSTRNTGGPSTSQPEDAVESFLVAAALTQVDAVRHFIEAVGLHPDSTFGRKPTAICYAALKAHLPLAEYLLEKGASVRLSDAMGMTPLHYATLGGSVACVALFVRHGADAASRNTSGKRPIDLTRGRRDLAECQSYLFHFGPGSRHRAGRQTAFH